MEYINTWLHSNITSNDEKLLNYTNEVLLTISCNSLLLVARMFFSDKFQGAQFRTELNTEH
jgi:hypothetical protein